MRRVNCVEDIAMVAGLFRVAGYDFGAHPESTGQHRSCPCQIAGTQNRHHGDVFDAIYATHHLQSVLARADAVVVTTPHTPETEQMLDAQAFAAIKPGAAFVNIARGQIVDEQALIEGLRSGHIGFAALDVAAVEPLPDDSPLWDMPNVLISPHSASTVFRENERITDIFCHNLRCYVEGDLGSMRNVLDKRRMY